MAPQTRRVCGSPAPTTRFGDTRVFGRSGASMESELTVDCNGDDSAPVGVHGDIVAST